MWVRKDRGKNKVGVIRDIKIILTYSAMNKIENNPPLYSILYPETNSDSPSGKSKGVRFNSASIEINQKIRIRGIEKKIKKFM